MGSKQFRVPLPTVLSLLSLGLLILLLGTRLQLSLVRYFDADELAYLHWAHNVFSGQLPYRDFLLYVPPGFLYVLAPVYMFFQGTMPLIAGRVFAFCIFVAMVGATSLLFWRVRRSWVALWAGIILVFLPLPADKLLEIRPDTLATLLALIGMLYQCDALRGHTRYASWTLSGFWYSASVLILPKTVPQIAVAYVISLLWMFWGTGTRSERIRALGRFALGSAVPIGVFMLWIALIAKDWRGVETVMYSLTRLPFEVNRIGEKYPILQWQFFYPNVTYYGAMGWNIGLLTNHSIWMIGLLVGVVRLVTPYIPNGKSGVWTELLIAGSLIAHSSAFIYGYPMRHAQYLIPIAVFVAFYAADLLDIAWKNFSRLRHGGVVCAVGFIVLALVVMRVSGTVNGPKFKLTNREDIAILMHVLATIPRDAYVLDLVGSTIYFQDPYPVCCVPFGQWLPYLSRPLPGLAGRLETTGTRYVYQGRLGRLTTLPESDQTYIRTHFSPLSGDSSFLVRNK